MQKVVRKKGVPGVVTWRWRWWWWKAWGCWPNRHFLLCHSPVFFFFSFGCLFVVRPVCLCFLRLCSVFFLFVFFFSSDCLPVIYPSVLFLVSCFFFLPVLFSCYKFFFSLLSLSFSPLISLVFSFDLPPCDGCLVSFLWGLVW